MRRHVKTGLSVASNTQEIIDTIDTHNSNLKWPKQPDQTHDKYYTYDFSCNEDYVKHAQYHEWKMLFDYFKNNDRAMGTAATKYVNEDLLDYNPNRKIRIRFSIMPQKYANILEKRRPVIVEEDAGILYQNLFNQVDKYVDDAIKEHVKCEVIFLTHNHNMHEYNMKKESTKRAEDLLWKPGIQEQKTSQYGNVNIRYKYQYKRRLIEAWKNSHDVILPWQEIRYIF
jgi:spore photoproduct lyase